MAIGGEGEQREHGDTLAAQSREPAIVEEPVLEPAEGARGVAHELGARRHGRSEASHGYSRRALLDFRFFALASSRSFASFSR